jgi:hypothetical protein
MLPVAKIASSVDTENDKIGNLCPYNFKKFL